jgi:hypothetical protein
MSLLDELVLCCLDLIMLRVLVRVIFDSFGLLGIAREFYLFHQMTDLLDLFLELSCFLLGLLLQGIDLVVGLITILISIVCFLDDISHFLAFLMKLALQFLVKIIEDDSFFPQAINDQLELLVNSDRLIELLISFIKPILQNLDLLL